MSVVANPPKSLRSIQKKYEAAEPIAMLTAYDFTSAQFVDAAGADIILVGDSLGQVIQGRNSTLPVTMDEMVYHTQCVRRGAPEAIVITDLPFLSYQVCAEDALRNAGRAMKEAGASGVKLEGGIEIVESVRRLVQAGIPVIGHIGLMPQHVHCDGYRQHGKDTKEADRLLADAEALVAAGVLAIVLEGIEATLAARITTCSCVPTIGIGAGPNCSGQVLVYHDVLGMTFYPQNHKPSFVREYANLREQTASALRSFVHDVKNKTFP